MADLKAIKERFSQMSLSKENNISSSVTLNSLKEFHKLNLVPIRFIIDAKMDYVSKGNEYTNKSVHKHRTDLVTILKQLGCTDKHLKYASTNELLDICCDKFSLAKLSF